MEHITLSATAPSQRLLIPIDPREESRWPIRYALRRASAQEKIEVFLVYFLPPTHHEGMLRFRAEQHDAEQLQKRANIFLEEAAVHLMAACVPCHKFVRDADPVQGIQDFAEEWACTDVVLPNAYKSDFFSGSQCRKLSQLEAILRVTWVKNDGSPVLELDSG
jgi:nucleotide-binding universal stress UspA family protein